MNKRKILLSVLLGLIFIGMIFCLILFIRTTPELNDSDIEEMRDTLKLYQQTEIPEVPETDPIETESPETVSETTVVPPPEELPGQAEDLPEEAETETSETPADEVLPQETAEPETLPPETEEPEKKVPENVESTLDFESMWEVNPDICAWIEIEGTKVDYPVLQSAEDDEKYLTTAHDGSPYIGGSLFTQTSYNAKDFNDPVTVIYGHTMRSGTLFGQLQSVYSDSDSFEEHSEITIYLPDEVRHYTVFAAVPYDNLHILHTYDFSVKYWYNNFFRNVRAVRSIGANFNREITPEYGDRVIILSTCLNEDSTRRFLVMAILQEDLSA